MKKVMRLIMYPVFLCLFFASPVSAALLRVPSEYGSIQDAIDDAGHGYLIVVSDGTYFENIYLEGKNINLRSESGPHACIIDNLIYGNIADSNGGVYIAQFGRVRLQNNRIFDNQGRNGGGIYG